VILTKEGAIVKSSLGSRLSLRVPKLIRSDNIQTQQYSTLVTQLTSKARGVVRDLDPEVDDINNGWDNGLIFTIRTTLPFSGYAPRSMRYIQSVGLKNTF
jgi:hypothetical protein